MTDPLLGRVLRGRYRIERKLGQGGMGVVYAGVHLELARPVAVKTLLDVVDQKDVDRFRNEALAAASLSHPHIIQVSDFAPPSGDEPAFLVMELLAGRSLARVLSERGALPRATAIHVTLQMLDAIGAAHRARILHRDIKPANVFVLDGPDPDRPWIKVLDFGIAKLMDDGSRRTTTGTMLGTPAYMAPEQIRGERATEATDLYAIGACLYEILAGSRPFAKKGGELMSEILKGDAPDLPVDAELAAIVRRSMNLVALERYPNAEALAAALRALQSPKPNVTPKPRTARWPLFVAVTAATVTLGVGGLVAIGRPPPAPVAQVDASVVTDSADFADSATDTDTDEEASVHAEPAPEDAAAPAGPHLVLSVCADGTTPLCTRPAWDCPCRTDDGFAVFETTDHASARYSIRSNEESTDGKECAGFMHYGESAGTYSAKPAVGRRRCQPVCDSAEIRAGRRMAAPGTACTGHYGVKPIPGKWREWKGK